MRYLLLSTLALAACGKSMATSHNNPGTGSSTLAVSANVDASSSAVDGLVTDFTVRVRDGLGTPVSGAAVKFHNGDFGDVVLSESPTGSGRYEATRPSTSNQDLTLSVVRNNDKVENVTVGNPGISNITAPALTAPLSANQPVNVTWTTPVEAQGAEISTRDFDARAPDTGAYTIPASGNPANQQQRLQVTRTNQVNIAGALSGSLTVTTTTSVGPFVVQ